MDTLFVESEVIIYKEIIGPAIYDRYDEDMMTGERIDFVFRKDAFKSTNKHVRNLLGVVKGQISRFEDDNWSTLGTPYGVEDLLEFLYKFAMKFKRGRSQLIVQRAVIVSWQTKGFYTEDQDIQWLEGFYIWNRRTKLIGDYG
ncbi:hypothetical protein Rs2_03168 [Raphanus sativus]|nr:hypothetical protein Rs2_03168 [Raphanus sativus]